jgi:Flp pilus assembly protein TadD
MHKASRSGTYGLNGQTVADGLLKLAFFRDLIFNHTAMATQQTFASAAVPVSTSDRRGTEPASRPKSLWILDRWRDLLFFVGTPLLLIPLFTVAQRRWSAQDIYLFVAAFGAMGHHLPGMIRAYGDRALFNRFRTRFIVAPIALLAVCTWASLYNVQAIQLLALTWGIWHGMMQTYGFGRIYDAKASAKAAGRARVDLALCFAWFLGPVLLSPMRLRNLLDIYYESGGAVIPAAAVAAGRMAVVIGLGLVTIVFLWREWSDWQGGRGASPVKMALLATSIAFWWYCNNGVQNILVGVALFEVFHDVQYLSIVWIYNRTRVERDESIRGFMRFVFRRSGALIGVYVGLVMAYGSISFLQSSAAVDWIKHGLLGVVTASALLHFYYDGFIWKVRETQTRAMLGIDGAGVSAAPGRRRAWPAWTAHGLRWAALAVPFGLLCAAQLLGRAVPPLERFAKVAEVVPQDPQAQFNYGKALHEAGRAEEAIPRYESAIARKPSSAQAEFYLGLALSDLREWDRSIEHYERALSLDPKNAKAECNLAGILVGKGMYDEARRRYEHSLQLDPTLFLAHKELGDLLCHAGEYDAAIDHYNQALRLRPNFPEAKDNLAFARSLAGH